jgi:hypothetical protein
MTRALILISLLGLVACAQPIEARIANRLEAAGIPPPMAHCMAKRWVKRLDLFQLRKIERLSSDVSRRYKDQTLTVTGLIDRVNGLDDPQIVRVVTASAAICAFKA